MAGDFCFAEVVCRVGLFHKLLAHPGLIAKC